MTNQPADDKPPKWREPIEAGLWRADQLFGIPFWLNLYHPIAWAIGWFTGSWSVFWVAMIAHAPMMVLTDAEPEWMEIARDWWTEPEEIEP